MNRENTFQELEAMASLACEVAAKAGADFADAAASSGRSVDVSVEKNGIKALLENRDDRVSVRCFVEGGMGIVSSPSLKEKDVREAAERALRIARVAEKDPDFVTLPRPEEYEEVPGLFDDELAGMSAGRVVELVAKEIESAREVDDRIVVIQGGAGYMARQGFLANSLGVRQRRCGTRLQMYLMTMLRKDEEVASASEFDIARRFCDFKAEGIGAEAARKTIRQLGAESVKTGRFPVVLGPLAAASLFEGFCRCANAEDVQRGRSFLADKKGKRIGSKVITLTDDGLIPGGWSSGAVDEEGSVRKRVEIVREGILKAYLHSLYTSLKGKDENTGHGDRGGWVSPTNVIPALGEKTARELMSELKEGVYAEEGNFSPSLQTGEISATADWGFWIKNGELDHPVRNTMVGGSAVELLSRIDGISSDYREEPGMIMPTVRIAEAVVAGAR